MGSKRMSTPISLDIRRAVSDVALHALHVCSGYAGFELALRAGR